MCESILNTALKHLWQRWRPLVCWDVIPWAWIWDVVWFFPAERPFQSTTVLITMSYWKHCKSLLWDRFYQAAFVRFGLFWPSFVSISRSDCSEIQRHDSFPSPSLFFFPCRFQPVPSISHPLIKSSMMEALSVLLIKPRLNSVATPFDPSFISRRRFYKQQALLLEQRLCG